MAKFIAICAIVALTCVLLVLLEVGRRLGKGREDVPGLNTVSAAVFGLMGLLIAFTFSGAALRFDQERHLIVEETNAISTAYLRVDLLPKVSQPPVRDDFRAYVDERLAVYREISAEQRSLRARRKAFEEAAGRAMALQKKIWNECLAAPPQTPDPTARLLLFEALNAMFDIATTRTVAMEIHPPPAIYFTLVMLVIAATLLAGYEMAGTEKRNWTHILLYSVILALAMYVIADLEFPRLGLIRVDASDHVLADFRRTM
jgi:hypothetical protein